MSPGRQQPLRRGDIVEVRPAAEIAATLDEDGVLDDMPFMPEMLQYVGRRFTVSRRVEKICDTIAATGSRRMHDTVYLENLRCDGSGHGGCQAGCRIYWKEAWLRRVDDGAEAVDGSGNSTSELEQLALKGTRVVREVDGEQQEVWRCQATEALRATEPLKTSDVRQYFRELKVRNIGFLRFLRVASRGFVMEVASRVGVIGALPLHGEGSEPASPEPLNLQPGELVRVRSADEIAPTLDANGFNRRLSFDREMLPYCGGTYRVRDRVERIIDERTGRMLRIPGDCLILDGVVCTGHCSVGRWFCPREVYPYWREAWLRRVETATTDAPPQKS
jgi:hypothetical protein